MREKKLADYTAPLYPRIERRPCGQISSSGPGDRTSCKQAGLQTLKAQVKALYPILDNAILHLVEGSLGPVSTSRYCYSASC
jgi:hypothetical protein